MKTAPIARDLQSLSCYLLGRFDTQQSQLQQRICSGCLDLVEHTALALKNFDQAEQLFIADKKLCILRSLLLLAHEQRLLDDAQLLHCSRLLEPVGKQLGAWRKKLDALEGSREGRLPRSG
jgi:hypothetical protein